MQIIYFRFHAQQKNQQLGKYFQLNEHKKNLMLQLGFERGSIKWMTYMLTATPLRVVEKERHEINRFESICLRNCFDCQMMSLLCKHCT